VLKEGQLEIVGPVSKFVSKGTLRGEEGMKDMWGISGKAREESFIRAGSKLGDGWETSAPMEAPTRPIYRIPAFGVVHVVVF